MAASRSSRSRPRSRNRRPGSRQSEANPAMLIILGSVAVLVVVVIAFTMMGQGEGKTGGKENQDLAAKTPGQGGRGKDASAKQPRASGNSAKASPGKTPDTPAPSIPAAVMAEAERYYQEAKKLNMAARKAQKSGDNAEFSKLINDSWDTLIKLDDLLEEYSDWLDAAIFGEWEIPAEYIRFQERLGKYEGLKTRVRKVKPNRR